MNSNDDPDMYISIARDFSMGMVLVLLCLHRIAQDMNERQQHPTNIPATEMARNEALNTPAAVDVNLQPNIPNHATPELEILSGIHGNRSGNPPTNFPPLPTVRRTHAPHVFHEMPTLQNPSSYRDAPGHTSLTYGAALRSPNQSVNSDMVGQQEPVELMGVDSTQACGNAMSPVELPAEMNSQDTELQLLTAGSIDGGTANNTGKTKLKTKPKTWYRKLHNLIWRHKSRK
ncbi:hypothetical protein BDZ91DRAFT_713354 [Kalaharituber pfeilii]|nr:hypothetical protein BDZ91DRAFT_713354 [Kalaharituber pfeilii]